VAESLSGNSAIANGANIDHHAGCGARLKILKFNYLMNHIRNFCIFRRDLYLNYIVQYCIIKGQKVQNK